MKFKKFFRSLDFFRLSQFFLAAAIFVLPLQIRSLVVATSAWQLGFFDEYAAFFVSIFDLFLLAAFFLLGISFARNEKNSLRFSRIKKFWILLAALVAVEFFAVAVATDLILALAFAWRTFVFAAAAVFFAAGWISKSFFARVFALTFFIQAVVGIGQYFAGGSLGLGLLGEPAATAETFNVAKVVLPSGEVFVRSFGTLAHANILGGCLAVALVILATIEKKNWLDYFLAVGLLAGLFFTFSRAAWLALAAGFLVLLLFNFRRRIFSLSVATVIFLILIANFGDPFFVRVGGQSAGVGRVEQISQAVEISKENLAGVGRGGYTLALANQFPELPEYNLQPVHNFFVLKFVEQSVIVSLAWLAVFVSLAVFAIRKKRFEALAILATFFVLAQFDHYLATSAAGEAMLFLSLGFVGSEIFTPKTVAFRRQNLKK